GNWRSSKIQLFIKSNERSYIDFFKTHKVKNKEEWEVGVWSRTKESIFLLYLYLPIPINSQVKLNKGTISDINVCVLDKTVSVGFD
ncbi:hypothetical protein KSF78_0009588, partial [Schistosoma japonicum]